MKFQKFKFKIYKFNDRCLTGGCFICCALYFHPSKLPISPKVVYVELYAAYIYDGYQAQAVQHPIEKLHIRISWVFCWWMVLSLVLNKIIVCNLILTWEIIEHGRCHSKITPIQCISDRGINLSLLSPYMGAKKPSFPHTTIVFHPYTWEHYT